MMKNRTRPVRIEFRVTEQERQLIQKGGFIPQINNYDDSEKDDVILIVPDNGRRRRKPEESGVVITVPDDGRFPTSYVSAEYTEAADDEQ